MASFTASLGNVLLLFCIPQTIWIRSPSKILKCSVMLRINRRPIGTSLCLCRHVGRNSKIRKIFAFPDLIALFKISKRLLEIGNACSIIFFAYVGVLCAAICLHTLCNSCRSKPFKKV